MENKGKLDTSIGTAAVGAGDEATLINSEEINISVLGITCPKALVSMQANK